MTVLQNYQEKTKKLQLSLCESQNLIVQIFDSAIQEKKLILELDLLDITHINMNPYLAETLIINLIKNAIIHNTSGGVLRIQLRNNALSISNSGSPLSFPEKDIFKRFTRSENSKKNLGIGLSIVQRICELYTFKITYTFGSEHQFKIIFKK